MENKNYSVIKFKDEKVYEGTKDECIAYVVNQIMPQETYSLHVLNEEGKSLLTRISYYYPISLDNIKRCEDMSLEGVRVETITDKDGKQKAFAVFEMFDGSSYVWNKLLLTKNSLRNVKLLF